MANQTITATATDLATGGPAKAEDLIAAGILVVDEIDAALGIYNIDMPEQVVEHLILDGELSLTIKGFQIDAEMA